MASLRHKLLLLCCLLAAPVVAEEQTDATAKQGLELKSFADPKQQQLFAQLTAELRCPKCQNQNIADSNAVVAVDMRQKTYQLVRDGQTYDEVIAYMKTRYGDFVHYQPPLRWSTVWLWLLPALAVVALFMTVIRRSRQTQQQVPDDTYEVVSGAQLSTELQAMIDAAARPKTAVAEEQKP
jgi:cytochrome c-type biogenesis protein CcmH